MNYFEREQPLPAGDFDYTAGARLLQDQLNDNPQLLIYDQMFLWEKLGLLGVAERVARNFNSAPKPDVSAEVIARQVGFMVGSTAVISCVLLGNKHQKFEQYVADAPLNPLLESVEPDFIWGVLGGVSASGWSSNNHRNDPELMAIFTSLSQTNDVPTIHESGIDIGMGYTLGRVDEAWRRYWQDTYDERFAAMIHPSSASGLATVSHDFE